MAEISYNSSKNFKDLFTNLLEYQSFKLYLENLPNQSNNMLLKQVLRVENPYDDQIVKMNSSPVNYADNKFFLEKLQEIQG